MPPQAPVRSDSLAERNGFELSVPLVQHENGRISRTFLSPPGEPIAISEGRRYWRKTGCRLRNEPFVSAQRGSEVELPVDGPF
jgi:hypothetical protein